MAEEKICGYCKENEAARKCDECGIDLCEICAKEVICEDTGPASKAKGVSITALKPGTRKKKVCPTCMEEVDIF